MVVTGANGFLGSYVVAALLKAGYAVTGLKRENSSTDEFDLIIQNELGLQREALLKNFTWKTADILDIAALDEAFENEEMVFHCAAKVAFKSRERNEMMAINAEGTANVVNACIKKNVKKLIHVSSTSSLGRTDVDSLISEDTEWEDNDNNTNYAISKHLGELEVWRGIEEGLNAVIVNPGIILGYGDWTKGSCRIFRNIAKGNRFYTKGTNGFVDAKDVANAMLLLANSDIHSQRFLVIGENRTYQSVLNDIALAIHKPSPNIELKKSYQSAFIAVVRVVAAIHPKSSLTPETVCTAMKKHSYSNAAIQKAIGFKFTPLADAIQLAGAVYVKNHTIL